MRYSPPLLAALGSLLLAAAACGAPVEPGAAAPLATEPAASDAPITAAAESTTASSSPQRETVVVTTTTAPDPTDPSAWPTVAPAAGDFCVDSSSQIAPMTPGGWQRFVLRARPSGNCDPGPILMMSLVLPGTSTRPGTLVTITIAGAGVPTPLGDPVVINGDSGFLSESAMADGSPSAVISIDVGGVPVEAHGTVHKDQLVAIIASFHSLDETEWADLVSSVAQPR